MHLPQRSFGNILPQGEEGLSIPPPASSSRIPRPSAWAAAPREMFSASAFPCRTEKPLPAGPSRGGRPFSGVNAP